MKIGSHHKLILLAGTLALLLALASPGGNVFGQGLEYSEKEAISIDRMLMCPVCPAETIDQAQVEISRQMKAVVREMLAQGASREEVLDFFVARYGLEVLAAPPKSGATLLVWVLPIVGMLAALAGAFLVIRSMASRNRGQLATAAMSPADLGDPGLEPFLEAVDRDLALLGDGGSTGPSPLASSQDPDGVERLREQETNREDDLRRNG